MNANKLLKCGDVREDGKIFWAYTSKDHTKEYWVTPEVFERRRVHYTEIQRRRRNRIDLPPRKWKVGDVREDGKIFWCRCKTSRNGELWVTAEKFEELRKRSRERDRKRMQKYPRPTHRPLKQGHTRHDGMVFWQYVAKYPSGELWVTPEKYQEMKESYAARRLQRDRNSARSPLKLLQRRVIARIKKLMGRRGLIRKQPIKELIGCDWDTLKAHIESKFQPGMGWDNGHLWHLDHIKPLAKSVSESELIQRFHYTNLQPLWAEDNMKKRKLDKHT